ncbi:Zinc finger, BED-type, partial [Trema orientale]
SVSSENKKEKREKKGKKESKEKPKTKKRQKSFAWNHFTIINKDPNNQRAACNYCGVDYAADTKRNGTSTLKAHIEYQCKIYPGRCEYKKQKVLSFTKKKKLLEILMKSMLVA